MSFNNVNGNSHIDALINHNLDQFTQTPYPPPAGNPSMQPQSGLELAGRPGGGDNSMPPQKKLSLLGNDSGNVGSQVRKDGVNAASNAGDDSMRNMVEMNNMNMQFTMLQGRLSMEAKFVEGLAKTIKDTGSKVAQLAG